MEKNFFVICKYPVSGNVTIHWFSDRKSAQWFKHNGTDNSRHIHEIFDDNKIMTSGKPA